MTCPADSRPFRSASIPELTGFCIIAATSDEEPNARHVADLEHSSFICKYKRQGGSALGRQAACTPSTGATFGGGLPAMPRPVVSLLIGMLSEPGSDVRRQVT
jgi:hypothetical protein